MGHTGPRTTATPLNYHIGVMNQLWTQEGGVWVFHPERVTPAICADLGDFIGGLNSAYHAQYGNAPFPTDPDSGGTTPTVPIINVPWGSAERYILDPFQCNAYAYKITVPANQQQMAQAGLISLAEFQGNPTLRQATLSTEPGDFGPGVIAESLGVEVSFFFNVGGDGAQGLVPGRDYYFNYRNCDPASGACTCAPTKNCKASFTVNWPRP